MGRVFQQGRDIFFDKQWLQKDDFIRVVDDYWKLAEARCPENGYSLDCWHGCFVFLRTKLKGWNIRKLGEQKKDKRCLLGELADIDKQDECRELAPDEWSHRYEVERQLE